MGGRDQQDQLEVPCAFLTQQDSTGHLFCLLSPVPAPLCRHALMNPSAPGIGLSGCSAFLTAAGGSSRGRGPCTPTNIHCPVGSKGCPPGIAQIPMCILWPELTTQTGRLRGKLAEGRAPGVPVLPWLRPVPLDDAHSTAGLRLVCSFKSSLFQNEHAYLYQREGWAASTWHRGRAHASLTTGGGPAASTLAPSPPGSSSEGSKGGNGAGHRPPPRTLLYGRLLPDGTGQDCPSHQGELFPLVLGC